MSTYCGGSYVVVCGRYANGGYCRRRRKRQGGAGGRVGGQGRAAERESRDWGPDGDDRCGMLMRGGAVGARALCTRLPSAAGPSPLHFPSIHKFNASPRSWLHFFLFLSQPIPCFSLQVYETTPSTKHGRIHQVCSFRYRGCGVADGWHLCPKVSYFPDSHVNGPSLTASRPLCAFASPFRFLRSPHPKAFPPSASPLSLPSSPPQTHPA